MLSLSDIVNVKVGIGRGVFEAPGATVIGGKKPSFNLEILKLFANGEQGFWYDPNDMGTMFQDAAGTIPVTAVGQPVGLVLDKSKGLVLGSELVTNGDASNGTVGWTTTSATLQNESNKFVLTTSAQYGGATNLVTLDVTKTYIMTIDVVGNTMNALLSVVVRPTATTTNYASVGITSTGKYQLIFRPTDASSRLIIQHGAANPTGSLTFDNVSIKEIAGNHAYQTQSAMRPLLVASPQRLDFDTADDKLITNLAAQLTGCTVIRAVPNVGTQILTNQTIPTTYNDNTDHCGLIVINRALTPSETSAIAAEFNKRAGV
ncbi:hypothetical protein HYI12_14670 [Acinetobacter sp. SwsAc3]|nr:hypothetical protein [Acinetobacter sp. SwsAc3]